MNKRSLTMIIVAVLAICGLIIPHLGFAANPKNKTIAKKAAVAQRKKPAAKKVIKAKAPVKKQIKKGNPAVNAKLNNKNRKPAHPIKKQPAKPNPKNNKNKLIKDAAAAKRAVGECPICLEQIALANAYETSCCKQLLCKTDFDKIKKQALKQYNNMQDPVWRAEHAASSDFAGWPKKVSKQPECPFCRAANLKITKMKTAPKVKPQKPAATKNCSICMDEKPVKEFIKLGCGHSDSCQECAQALFDDAIKNKQVDKAKKINEALRCPHVGDKHCNTPLTEQDIRAIVKNDPARMKQYQAILDEEWIHENTNPCRTPDCKGRFAKEQGAQAMRVRCPECRKQCCSACLFQHDPHVMTCAEAEAAAEDNGDRAYADWAKKNARPCPNCNARIEKDGGCNAVTCNNCRYQFCWVCGSEHDHTHGHKHVYLGRDGYEEPANINPNRINDGLFYDPNVFDYQEYMEQHNFNARHQALYNKGGWEILDQFRKNVENAERAQGRDPFAYNKYNTKEFADIELQELAKLEKKAKASKKGKKQLVKRKKVVKPKVQPKKKIKKAEPGMYINGIYYKNIDDYALNG